MSAARSVVGGSFVVLSACATLKPPAHTTGPVASADGVQLTVTRQRCERSRSADEPEQYLIEETVEVDARGSAPLEIRRDEFRLVTPHGFQLRPVSWNAAEPVTSSASGALTFALRFMANGTRDCAAPVTLDPGFAVKRNGMPVALGTITFTPSGRP
jgi:hypothetical protein